MMYSKLKNILKQHQLRVTDCRMDVLEFFTKNKKALSFRNLEKELEQYDRVTLYRTLNSFTENGVLHRIPDDSGYATYGVCSESCHPHDHHHDHMHFKCVQCGEIECMSDKHLPKVQLPNGYQIGEVNLIVNGYCPQCG